MFSFEEKFDKMIIMDAKTYQDHQESIRDLRDEESFLININETKMVKSSVSGYITRLSKTQFLKFTLHINLN